MTIPRQPAAPAHDRGHARASSGPLAAKPHPQLRAVRRVPEALARHRRCRRCPPLPAAPDGEAGQRACSNRNQITAGVELPAPGGTLRRSGSASRLSTTSKSHKGFAVMSREAQAPLAIAAGTSKVPGRSPSAMAAVCRAGDLCRLQGRRHRTGSPKHPPRRAGRGAEGRHVNGSARGADGLRRTVEGAPRPADDTGAPPEQRWLLPGRRPGRPITTPPAGSPVPTPTAEAAGIRKPVTAAPLCDSFATRLFPSAGTAFALIRGPAATDSSTPTARYTRAPTGMIASIRARSTWLSKPPRGAKEEERRAAATRACHGPPPWRSRTSSGPRGRCRPRWPPDLGQLQAMSASSAAERGAPAALAPSKDVPIPRSPSTPTRNRHCPSARVRRRHLAPTSGRASPGGSSTSSLHFQARSPTSPIRTSAYLRPLFKASRPRRCSRSPPTRTSRGQRRHHLPVLHPGARP